MEDLVLVYLNYIKQKIQNLDDKETFIAFDLSDQYIGGLFVSKGKKGLLKTSYGTTEELTGWGVSSISIEQQVIENRQSFKADRDWLLSNESVEKGIDWSKGKIKMLPKSKVNLY